MWKIFTDVSKTGAVIRAWYKTESGRGVKDEKQKYVETERRKKIK